MASFHKYESAKGTRWLVSWRANRKQRTKRGFDTKKLAQRWYAENVALKDEAGEDLPMPTIAELWETAQQRHSDWKITTKQVHDVAWRHDVEPRWGNKKPSEVIYRDVQDWLDEDVAPKFSAVVSTKARLIVLRHCLHEAIVREYITTDPTVNVVCKATGKGQPRKNKTGDEYTDEVASLVLTDEQLQLFIDCVPTQLYKDIVVFLAATGVRWGEMSALRPIDVSMEERRISITRTASYVGQGKNPIRKPKTGKARVIAFPQSAYDVLVRRIAACEKNTDLLFPSPRTHSYIVSYGCSGWFGKAVDEARKIDPTFPVGFHPHALRHTAVSRWLSQGVDIGTIATQVGHSNIQTTLSTYSHLMPDKLGVIANM